MNYIRIENSRINTTIGIDLIENLTSETIKQNLPISSKAQVWGDEIYFETGIEALADGGTQDLEVGDIAYWPQGKCICIFFGPTPMSTGEKPVPASDVIIIAKADLDPDVLRKVLDGDSIELG